MIFDITKYNPLELFVIFLKTQYPNNATDLIIEFRNFVREKQSMQKLYMGGTEPIFHSIASFGYYLDKQGKEKPEFMYDIYYHSFLKYQTNILQLPHILNRYKDLIFG